MSPPVPDDQPDADISPVLADAVRDAYVQPVDEGTARRHLSLMVATAAAGHAPARRRLRQHRRAWRSALAATATTLLLPVGLAAAGVTLPGALEQPYRAIGIDLPHQSDDRETAPSGRPARATATPAAPATPPASVTPAAPARPGKATAPAGSATPAGPAQPAAPVDPGTRDRSNGTTDPGTRDRFNGRADRSDSRRAKRRRNADRRPAAQGRRAAQRRQSAESIDNPRSSGAPSRPARPVAPKPAPVRAAPRTDSTRPAAPRRAQPAPSPSRRPTTPRRSGAAAMPSGQKPRSRGGSAAVNGAEKRSDPLDPIPRGNPAPPQAKGAEPR